MSEHTTGGSDTRSEAKTLLDYMVKGVYDVAKRLIAQQRDLRSQYSLLCSLTSYVDRLTTWQRDTDNDDDLDELFSGYSPDTIGDRINAAYDMSLTQAMTHEQETSSVCYLQFTQAGEVRPTIYPGRAAILTYFLADRSRSPLAKGLSEAAQAELDQLTAELDAYYQAHKGVDQWELINGYMAAHGKPQLPRVEDVPPPTEYWNDISRPGNELFTNSTKFPDCVEKQVRTGAEGDILHTVAITLDRHMIDDAIAKYGIELTKELEPYDHIVYAVVDAIWLERMKYGSDPRPKITLSEVAQAVSGTEKPHADVLVRVRASMHKMRTTLIRIDNAREIENGFKYKHFTYDDYLLPCRVISAIDRSGKVNDAVFEIYDELPIMRFSRGRGQGMFLPLSTMRAPIKHTTMTDAVLAYITSQYVRWQGRRKAAYDKLDKLQRKARRHPDTITVKERDALVKLEKSLKTPLRMIYSTIVKNVTDAMHDTACVTPEAQKKRVQRIQAEVGKQLEQWQKDGLISRWSESVVRGKEGVSLWQNKYV